MKNFTVTSDNSGERTIHNFTEIENLDHREAIEWAWAGIGTFQSGSIAAAFETIGEATAYAPEAYVENWTPEDAEEIFLRQIRDIPALCRERFQSYGFSTIAHLETACAGAYRLGLNPLPRIREMMSRTEPGRFGVESPILVDVKFCYEGATPQADKKYHGLLAVILNSETGEVEIQIKNPTVKPVGYTCPKCLRGFVEAPGYWEKADRCKTCMNK